MTFLKDVLKWLTNLCLLSHMLQFKALNVNVTEIFYKLQKIFLTSNRYYN